MKQSVKPSKTTSIYVYFNDNVDEKDSRVKYIFMEVGEGLRSHLRLIREEDKHLVGGVVVVGHQHDEI